MLEIIINITIILNCNNISQYCCFCFFAIFGSPLRKLLNLQNLKKIIIIQLNVI